MLQGWSSMQVVSKLRQSPPGTKQPQGSASRERTAGGSSNGEEGSDGQQHVRRQPTVGGKHLRNSSHELSANRRWGLNQLADVADTGDHISIPQTRPECPGIVRRRKHARAPAAWQLGPPKWPPAAHALARPANVAAVRNHVVVDLV